MADTIVSRFFQNADRLGSRPSQWFKRDGRWVPVGWRAAAEIVRGVGAGLIELGHQPGDATAICASTRREWLSADLGSLAAGGVTIGVYPTMTRAQQQYIYAHCEARFAVVEDAQQLATILAERANLPRLTRVVVMEPAGVTPSEAADFSVCTFTDLVRRGQRSAAALHELEQRRRALTHEQAAIFVYTSGTTGPPKGAMITHGNIMAGLTSMQALRVEEDDVGFSFLPLAHVFQRAVNYRGILHGIGGYFAESIEKLPDNLAETGPTVVAAVPRIFEKVHARILSQVATSSPLRQRIFRWALGVGTEVSRLRQANKPIPRGLELGHRVARRLVFDKLKQRLGGRIRMFVTGGAPIAKEILEFFDAADISIYEGWGMTETFAAGSVNLPGATRFGSIGRPMPGVQLKLDEDGELLIRGGAVFAGYYKDEAATRDAFTADGWFRTGDIARVDADGFYAIVDRKKDLIITAGGKNIAPQNIENLIKTDTRISQVVVCGDRKPYLVALVTLAKDELLAWARTQGITSTDGAELARDPRVNQAIGEAIGRVNGQLASYETVKKFRILPADFSIESGELTPSLKVKRKVVTERHLAELDALYGEDPSRVTPLADARS